MEAKAHNQKRARANNTRQRTTRAEQTSKEIREKGMLTRVLAVVLAINMAFMLAMPAGAIANQATAFSEDLVAASTQAAESTNEAQQSNTANGGDTATSQESAADEQAESASFDDENLISGDSSTEGTDQADTNDEAPAPAEAAQAEADEADEAIAPLATVTLGPGQVAVDTWDDLRSAISNTANNYIRLDADITRTNTATSADLATIGRTLTIDGNGHTLNFGGSITRNGSNFQLT
ncbi:MAG: hypothetical protein LBB42_05190, partial [Coriobacteriales bacterium]|nr:hypothetical protein [Coriobacteriales bacterium]